ncbi:actin-like ATPase domain-containing protein [Fragilariopsis cylindrus CCMP1102]|uniref:Actin-like ATPase domain-containing protein n=1 Tax=Fragilariopsis cylindrus CCMP1102 TaxID=635003 RepID=A0A1E7FXH0_9STRA|nr:actin-like ATPase domain-containing protein [Fragilariopsis cylindrus CCMP1102]|eukprot:OEU22851.1 actin-like ATPase domain-containing protein [Fragilariopsis cylindrus CCMP1102]
MKRDGDGDGLNHDDNEKINDFNHNISDNDNDDVVHDDDDDDDNNTNIILAIDVGSSSVRTTAYRYSSSNNNNEIVDVVAIPNCSSSISGPAVEPTTGIIQTNGLMDAIDRTIDEVLSKLRSRRKIDNDNNNNDNDNDNNNNNNNQGFRIEAVGFSTFVMNLIAMTNHTTTITPAASISYACNAPEVNRECQRIRQQLGPDELDRLYEATGAPLHSAYALPQLRVLYNNKKNVNNVNSRDDSNGDSTSKQQQQQQQHHSHGYRWQSIAGYCLSRWSGRQKHLPISYSEASWTGLLNVRDCVYDESALQLLPSKCRETLPELADFSEYVYGIQEHIITNNTNDVDDDDDDVMLVKNPYWTRFVELRETKFFLGIGDGACANIGSKCTTSSRIAVTIGTSAAARTSSTSLSNNSTFFQIPECRGLFCYRIDRRHVLVGGALTDGGSVVEWASRFLNLDRDKASFDKCLDETRDLIAAEQQLLLQQQGENDRPWKDKDLRMVPFLSGERSTGFRDGATGAVFGLTRETTPAIFFKSCLEGVSLRLKAILDLLLLVIDKTAIADDTTTTTTTTTGTTSLQPVLVASGKAMETNEIWRQMIADCCGLHVVLDEDSAEGTSRGVARLVAMSLIEEGITTAETSSTGGCDGDSSTNIKNTAHQQHRKSSLILSQHEEKLRPSTTSEPRPTATALYSRKARSQEEFIDSISPLYSSS